MPLSVMVNGERRFVTIGAWQPFVQGAEAAADRVAVASRAEPDAADGASSRATTIASAKRRLAVELKSGKTVLCSERAWVNDALRGEGLPPLSNDEVAQYDVGCEALDEPRAVATIASRGDGQAAGSRASLIGVALQGFQRELDRGKTILCSRRAWVNQVFRDARRPLPTADELCRAGVPVEACDYTGDEEQDD